MSETEQKEQELVAGTIGGITLKKEGTWTVAIKPEGAEYAKNLWTKSKTLVGALEGKLGQHGAFVCNASYWTRQDGQQVRSLWIETEADGTENLPERVATPAAAPKSATSGTSNDAMTKEEWARKDRAADLRACLAIATSALQHTVKSEPDDDDLNEFVRRALFVARQFHGVVTAERTGEDVSPF